MKRLARKKWHPETITRKKWHPETITQKKWHLETIKKSEGHAETIIPKKSDTIKRFEFWRIPRKR